MSAIAIAESALPTRSGDDRAVEILAGHTPVGGGVPIGIDRYGGRGDPVAPHRGVAPGFFPRGTRRCTALGYVRVVFKILPARRVRANLRTVKRKMPGDMVTRPEHRCQPSPAKPEIRVLSAQVNGIGVNWAGPSQSSQ